MIETDEDGIKIAENSEEKFWIDVREKCNKAIENNKHEIVINEHVIKLCEQKLKPFSKA